MSPASSGSLEVERYIGTCLISSHSRAKTSTSAASVVPCGNSNSLNGNCNTRDVYYSRESFMRPDVYGGGYMAYRSRRCNSVDGWAGGMPLISFANHQRRNRRPDINNISGNISVGGAGAGGGLVDATARCSSPRVADDVPLSRLAVHTQGLPLILSGRQVANRRTKAAARNLLPQGRGVVDSTKKIGECKDNHVNGVDALSVASDESSGSNNSETSLPRIIKPRKRRKKDRKPHPNVRNPGEIIGNFDTNSIGPSSPVTSYCYDRFHPPRGDHHHRFVVRNVSGTVRDTSETNDLSSETPQLHHRFEDVVGGLDDTEAGDDNGEPSSCQCRYCDPAGQIWDVDRHCYSPFLTTPPLQTQLSSDSSSSSSSSSSSEQAVPVKRHPHYFSDRISSALQNQCLISPTFSSDDNGRKTDMCSPNRTHNHHQQQQQQCLEISTKIVTSPNGHRDLEIRLFSSSSSCPSDDDTNSTAYTTNNNDTSKVPIRKSTSDKCFIKNSNKCDDHNENHQNLLPEE